MSGKIWFSGGKNRSKRNVNRCCGWKEIHKSFEDFKAVSGADLTVEKGQLVAVIGPNGAGKTTLFNLITGQLKPDQGKDNLQR